MAGLNRVVLVGRLTKEPEVKKTNSGLSVCTFDLAVDTSRSSTDKSAMFIRCTSWNKTAETVSKYCTKGMLVGVEGRLSQRNYETKAGEKRSSIEVVIDNFQFLEKKKDNTESEFESAPVSEKVDSGSTLEDTASYRGIDSTDDDLPF